MIVTKVSEENVVGRKKYAIERTTQHEIFHKHCDAAHKKKYYYKCYI